jgi:hypothetical protein
MSTRALSGAKMLRWSAALLLIGGPLLGLLSGSLGMAALAFGFGAVHLGLAQLWASENRGGRLIGFALVLGGASTVLHAGIWMLSAAGF